MFGKIKKVSDVKKVECNMQTDYNYVCCLNTQNDNLFQILNSSHCTFNPQAFSSFVLNP